MLTSQLVNSDLAGSPGTGQCEFCRVDPSEAVDYGCDATAIHGYCGHCRVCKLCGRYWRQPSRSKAVWGYQQTPAEREAALEAANAADPEYAALWALPVPGE